MVVPRLRCGVVLRSEEDACQVVTGGETASVRYAPQFPTPRRERVLPGHLVAVAETAGAPGALGGPGAPGAPGESGVLGASGMVVWRWYDAVVLGSDVGSVWLWEPTHGEVSARRRWPQRQYGPGTRAYLSRGLPGADWWVAGAAVDRAEGAEVELDEVVRLYDEHDMWDSVLGGSTDVGPAEPGLRRELTWWRGNRCAAGDPRAVTGR